MVPPYNELNLLDVDVLNAFGMLNLAEKFIILKENV